MSKIEFFVLQRPDSDTFSNQIGMNHYEFPEDLYVKIYEFNLKGRPGQDKITLIDNLQEFRRSEGDYLEEPYAQNVKDELYEKSEIYRDNGWDSGHKAITVVYPTSLLEQQSFFTETTTRGGDRRPFLDPRTRRGIKAATLFKRYYIERVNFKSPYKNYENNDSDINCVQNYIKKRYPKFKYDIGTKPTIQDIQTFAEKYDLSVNLLNITGTTIYKREGNKKKSMFKGIIANHHLYPNFSKKMIPEFYDNETDTTPKDSIQIIKSNKRYSSSGVQSSSKFKFEAEMFQDIPTNFSYKSEQNVHPQALRYYSGDSVDMIDANKCYYNQMKNLTKIGIFDCFSDWSKFKYIDIFDMYIIRPETMKNLKYFQNNVVLGFMLKFLLDQKKLKVYDVQFQKFHSTTMSPDSIKIKDDHKMMNVYNGILGKKESDFSIYLKNVHDDDFLLFDKFEDTTVEHEDLVLVKKSKTYKYFNHRHVYNHVVESANVFMLKQIYKLESEGFRIQKVKTDSIGVDKQIKNIPSGFKRELKNSKDTKSFFIIGKSFLKKFEDETKFSNISIQGPPGSGKSYTVKNEYEYDYAMALTNVCARQIDGKTIFASLQLFDTSYKSLHKFANKTIWIDEFSMISRSTWNFIVLLNVSYGTKFIITGDLNQVGPIEHGKIKSDLFKRFLGTTTFLSVDHRNDDGIIKLRNMVLNEETLNTESVDYKKFKRHLCYTNKKKTEINDEIMKFGNLEINSPGMYLTPKETKKAHSVFKGDLYIVQKDMTLKNYYTGAILSRYSIEDYVPGFAMTIHSSQGSTIDEPFCVHEVKKLSKELAYTAITRGTKIDNIHLL